MTGMYFKLVALTSLLLCPGDFPEEEGKYAQKQKSNG